MANVRLDQQAVEVLAREPLLRLNAQGVESLVLPEPHGRLAHQAVEALALPVPSVLFSNEAVEVLWREQGSPDVFIWPHNWVAEVRERLEWRTDVMVPRNRS